MDIIFLDQNKWIELARVEANKKSSTQLRSLYSQLMTAVARQEVLIPLSLSHIIETSKRNDPVSREHLARTQAKLSRGHVIRSRKGRLIIEFRFALKKVFNEPLVALPDNWAIVQGFIQAFEQFDELVAPSREAAMGKLINEHIRPEDQLYDFLTQQDEGRRRRGIATFLHGSDELLERIVRRRESMNGISREMQYRAYGGQLFCDHQCIMLSQIASIGKTIDDVKQLSDETMAKIIDDVPTLNIERDLAMKLEAQDRALERNDFLDMYSMCSAIPYSTWVIGEKMFINLANQCKLDKKYGSMLSTKLLDLYGKYGDCPTNNPADAKSRAGDFQR